MKKSLGALFYPNVKFDSLFIPYIYKEIYIDGIYVDVTNGQKDMVVMDVGANIGIVTQYLRDFAKIVYSLEPSSEHYEALEHNATYNGWSNVVPFKMAISDKDGEETLLVNESNRTMHTLKDTSPLSRGSSAWTREEKVKTQTFATFLKEQNIDKVDFCKFDVEGSEEAILKSEGFTSVCQKIKNIEIEFHFASFPELVKHMVNLGYSPRRYPTSSVVILFSRP